MLLRMLAGAALLVTFVSMGAAAQNASSVVAAASKAMGVDTLNSITFSGTARNGAFGQSKAIGNPLGPVNLTQITTYTRTITFATGGQPDGARFAGDRTNAAADGAGCAGADAGCVQPEHHRACRPAPTGIRR